MEQQRFTSRLTSVLTLLGVAIGLGNVWRFPYMMGKFGGSAFLAVYILLTILFAFPALMAEMTLGQLSRKGTVDSLRLGFGKPMGSFFGYLLIFVVTVAGSYYAVVVANVVFTTLFSGISGFSQETQPLYGEGLSNGWLQYTITVVLIGLSLYTIDRGLTFGIEKVSRRVMPLFFLALLYMIVHALTLPNAMTKFAQFLTPDFGALGLPEVFAALGQAFFSVGLGGTFVVVYSGFLKSDENVPSVALYTGLGDASASLLFSLFLIPSILVFDLDMNSGPGLIFNTLPQLFAAMPGGRFVGTLFLLSISVVAFLSLVAAYQVPFTTLQQEWPTLNRRKILISIGIVQLILALPTSLFPEFIGPLDLIFGSGMQVFGSALCIIGLTWGLSRARVMDHMLPGSSGTIVQRSIYVWIKWVIPYSLLAVLVGYLYEVLQ